MQSPVVSYSHSAAKNDQIMSSEDVAKTRKHHSKRFSRDSLQEIISLEKEIDLLWNEINKKNYTITTDGQFLDAKSTTKYEENLTKEHSENKTQVDSDVLQNELSGNEVQYDSYNKCVTVCIP